VVISLAVASNLSFFLDEERFQKSSRVVDIISAPQDDGGIFSGGQTNLDHLHRYFPHMLHLRLKEHVTGILKFKPHRYRLEVLGRSIIDLVEGMYLRGAMSDMRETIRDDKVLYVWCVCICVERNDKTSGHNVVARSMKNYQVNDPSGL
jgi:hypothetical protein